MLTTNQRGTLAETKIMAAAVERGIGVAIPLDDERYDLILDLRPRLLRVQCKSASKVADVVCVRLYTSRRGPEGLINRRYRAGEFDAFGAYCPEVDACYLLPAEDFVAFRQAHLRLSRCRNNQRAGIRWAREFEFGATLSRLAGP